jgi:hypothetical protein
MKQAGNSDLRNPILEESDTINPYYRGSSLLVNRIKWDLNPQSWIARNRLNKLKNRNDGLKAVILCNGPSLLKSDLSLLNKIYTFGLNKINLLFDSSAFRPSCIVSANKYVINQNRDFYNSTDIQLFLDSYALKIGVKARKNVIFFHSVNIDRFARDCSLSVFQGYTVTFVALQLAFHMGFKEVALIGCDHEFKKKGPANMVVNANENDVDHFHKQYFSQGQEWQLPDMERSELYYNYANNVYCTFNKKIINATVGGKLEIFERVDLAEFIAR